MQGQQPNNQQPYNPNQQPPTRHKRRTSKVMLSMISCGVIIILCVVTWIILSFFSSSDNGKTQYAAYKTIEPSTSQPAIQDIKSSLGVNVEYNQTLMAGFGFDGVITYSSSDLDQSRPYSIIRIRPIETSEATRNTITIASPELRVTTSTDKDFWDNLRSKDGYKDLSKTDALVKRTIDERTEDSHTAASNTKSVTLGDGIKYKMITLTSDDDEFAVHTTSKEYCYITVQNDRPYVACINNIRPSNFATVPALQSVLEDITYSEPDTSALTVEESDESTKTSMYDGKNDEEIKAKGNSTSDKKSSEQKQDESEDRVRVPDYIADSSDFSVFAKAEPATVRIGTVYCANISLLTPDGNTGTHLTGACVDMSSTGFIISSDGLVAALANKVQVTPREAVQAYITNAGDNASASSRLSRMLNYLQDSRILMESDVDSLTSGFQQRDKDAVAKINSLSKLIPKEDIVIDSETYKYAISLSDKPIVVNRDDNGVLDFSYSDSVLKASLIGARQDDDVSADNIFKYNNPTKDVALLQLDKKSTYPVLSVRKSDDSSNGLKVNIIGMPMYASGTLMDGQLSSIPLLRSGKVEQSINLSAGNSLQVVNTPSYPGLSGAPVMNGNNQVVGAALYDDASCSDDSCFSSMLVRRITPVFDIADRHNINVNNNSIISEVWAKAIDQYVKGNYPEAYKLFIKSSNMYPQNYLAQDFAALANTQKGSSTDTSLINGIISVLKIIVIISSIALVLLIIFELFSKMFFKPQRKSQYAHLSNGEYIDPNQWNKGGGYKSSNDNQFSGFSNPTVGQAAQQPQQMPQQPPQNMNPQPPQQPTPPQSPQNRAALQQPPVNQDDTPRFQ